MTALTSVDERRRRSYSCTPMRLRCMDSWGLTAALKPSPTLRRLRASLSSFSARYARSAALGNLACGLVQRGCELARWGGRSMSASRLVTSRGRQEVQTPRDARVGDALTRAHGGRRLVPGRSHDEIPPGSGPWVTLDLADRHDCRHARGESDSPGSRNDTRSSCQHEGETQNEKFNKKRQIWQPLLSKFG